ncbi:hypothetical protein CYMTET_44771, partial [Cymbomonas tetramitiformis]
TTDVQALQRAIKEQADQAAELQQLRDAAHSEEAAALQRFTAHGMLSADPSTPHIGSGISATPPHGMLSADPSPTHTGRAISAYRS